MQLVSFPSILDFSISSMFFTESHLYTMVVIYNTVIIYNSWVFIAQRWWLGVVSILAPGGLGIGAPHPSED